MNQREPRLLDLFCGGGAASAGYADAGWDVWGVDLRAQPLYPFPFTQGDALTCNLDDADAIHASPPCQGYSGHTTSDGRWDRTNGVNEPRLIEPVRDRLVAAGVPYVIENVVGARWALRNPVLLCGTMFGLPIARHRLFESNVALHAPTDGGIVIDGRRYRHPDCRGVAKAFAAWRGWDYRDMTVTGKGRRTGTSERWAEIMGITFPMSQHNFREAIPPAYSNWVGRQLFGLPSEAPETLWGLDNPPTRA